MVIRGISEIKRFRGKSQTGGDNQCRLDTAMSFRYREGARAGAFIPLIAGLAIAFVAAAQATK